jgi:hypothetical protein
MIDLGSEEIQTLERMKGSFDPFMRSLFDQ